MQIERDGLYDPGTPYSTMPGGNGTSRILERTGLRSLAAASPRTEFEPFRIDVHHEREVVRVAPVGELDLATVAPLGRRLDELRASGCRSVVLDLRGLTFIDASGLRLIVSCDAQARQSGIEFAIIQGPHAVRRVFDITGLLQWLPFRAISAENGASPRRLPARLGRMPAPTHQQGHVHDAPIGTCSEGPGG